MPYRDPVKQAAYLAKWQRDNREALRLRKRERYRKNIKRERARKTEWNRKQGHVPRVASRPASKRARVSIRRRAVVIDNKAFFNSKLGFERGELETIIAQLLEPRS